ncbi:trimeric intracellular cation channel family protein [Bermanella sp. WJH001]|uniref:trimeric intracellular cation channel family protein n=1 Tax=Bermanella sp. WJH001 TaxID=3048005 RepID=UPI0024BE5D25|nr:trimeric intracellular cation channel family protein [Bermanella sp. WJH001]MDJ1537854.1 trimeric intracellular cation channel family protein [Bermanella sp. WJH001]
MSFDLLYIAGLAGIAVFAVSGALAAAEKELDILGFILFATVTGIGGGTVRDLILGVEVAWVANPIDLKTCIGAAIITYFTAKQIIRIQRLLVWMDAMGLALFSVLGTAKAYHLGADPLVAIAMGMLTPTFGSVIRDILLDRAPVLLEPEIYVSAAITGSVSYLVFISILDEPNLSTILAIACAFLVRGAAIIFDLRLPKFKHH